MNTNNSNKMCLIVTQRKDKRYVLRTRDGEIYEDAQGDGFMTHEKADNYASSHGWKVLNPHTKTSANQLNMNALPHNQFSERYIFSLNDDFDDPRNYFFDVLIYDEGASETEGVIVMIDSNGDRVYFPWEDDKHGYYAAWGACNHIEVGFSSVEEALAFGDWIYDYDPTDENLTDEEYDRAMYFCYNDYLLYCKKNEPQ